MCGSHKLKKGFSSYDSAYCPRSTIGGEQIMYVMLSAHTYRRVGETLLPENEATNLHEAIEAMPAFLVISSETSLSLFVPFQQPTQPCSNAMDQRNPISKDQCNCRGLRRLKHLLNILKMGIEHWFQSRKEVDLWYTGKVEIYGTYVHHEFICPFLLPVKVNA